MVEIISIVILITLSGFFSMSELSLISSKKSLLQKESLKGNKNAKLALEIANHPNKMLSTVQIGSTLSAILVGILSSSLFSNYIQAALVSINLTTPTIFSLANVVMVIFFTYLSILFGELVPKRIGLAYSEKAAKIIAIPMRYASLIMRPFVWVLSQSTQGIVNMLNITEEEQKVTEDEIISLIQESTENGDVQEVEQDIMERVLLLGDLKVESIMTHRSDLVYLDISKSNNSIKEIIENNLFEMYPIVKENLDDVVGVVRLKNLILKIDKPDFDIKTVMEEPTYFHERMDVYRALEAMKEKKISQALVCDEFGSCQGIITLKDILEALIGNIDEVHEEPDIIERKDGGWLVDGQCLIYDFLTYFDEEDFLSETTEYTTIAGLVLDQLQHIPKSGETFEWHDFSFEVVDMDGARIDKLLIKKTENKEETDNNE